MRVVKYALIIFLLLGCQKSVDTTLNEMVNDTIIKVNESEIFESNNHKKALFSYYLPKDIGILEANKISSVLIMDDIQVFMGINVSEIMSETVRLNLENVVEFEVVEAATTYNKYQQEINNEIIIEKLTDSDYLLYVKSAENFFMAILKKASIPNVLEKILVVARSIEIDKIAVIAEFSNKETINYQQEIIELFSDSIPEEGFLNDIYPKDEGDEN